jgi:C-terminal peptidase prc
MSIFFLLLTTFAFAQEMTVRSVDLIRRKYLWYDDLDPKLALISAAEELEREIPWIIVEDSNDQIFISKGNDTPFGTVNISNATMANVESYLFQLSSAMNNTPTKLDKDVDIELVLLDGFSRELDRYSILMYKDSLENFNERISGKFSGIGCRVQKNESGLSLQEVFPDGPAFIGGLKENDIITHVDGVSLSALTLQQGVSRLRGEVGTRVDITIQRGEISINTVLVRDHVRVPNVHWSIQQDDIGVITIRNFSEQTMSWVNQALNEFKGQSLNGIIIDLRNNGGGSMLQSCKLVDRFVKHGVTLKTVGKDGKSVPGLMRQYNNKNDFNEPDLPIIVLVNGRSASASEIVSGSLKILDRALLVGAQTYGKGVVQTAPRVRTGKPEERVSFKMTVAQYILAEDYSVHEKDGVTPHIILSGLDYSEPPFVSLSNSPSDLTYLSDTGDLELDFAVEVLKRSKSNSIAHLTKLSNDVISEWEDTQYEKISEAYANEGIDWKEGKNENVDIDIDLQPHEPFHSGENAEIEILLRNNGPSVFQSYLWLQAEDSTSPWDGIIVPVGFIAEESAITQKVSIEIDDWMMDRTDKIQPVLLQECCTETNLEPFFITSKSKPQPTIPVELQISSIEGGYNLSVSLENKSDRELKDIHVRMIWPDDTTKVTMETNEWKEDSFLPNESKFKSFYIQTDENLSKLPDFLIRLDADGYSKILRTEISPEQLTSPKSYLAPQVRYEPPLTNEVGLYKFSHNVSDDGTIANYEAWFNGNKVHWQDKQGDITLTLDLEEGHNNLILYIEDEQKVMRKEVIKIFGLPKDYPKTDLEVSEETDE